MNFLHVLNGILGGALVILIRAYQILLAPHLVGSGCRHLPSCSEYAIEALRRHGVWQGGGIALARLWRCRPKGTYGYDPVPEAPSASSVRGKIRS